MKRRRRRTREQSQLLHELRVHLRLGPLQQEPLGRIEVHIRLDERLRTSRGNDIEFQERARVLAERCLVAGVTMRDVVNIIRQERKR